jgi:hypothetical protein
MSTAEHRGRDLVGYAGAPPDPRWPGAARVAVSFVINFEEGAEFSVSEGDERNEGIYEVDHRLAGPDPCIESHFEPAAARRGRRLSLRQRRL